MAEARRLAIMVVGGGARTEAGAVELLGEEISKYKYLKANGWEIKFLWPYSKAAAVAKGVTESDIRYSNEWRLAYEIRKAAYGLKKYKIKKLGEGDQFLLWMNTHGGVGHNSIGANGTYQHFNYSQNGVTELLGKIKENKAKLGFYISACYSGMMIDALSDLGCAVANGSSQMLTSMESDTDLTHLNTKKLSDYSMFDWYLNLLSSSNNLPESNADAWGRNLHMKILNLVHDDAADPKLEPWTPTESMGYKTFVPRKELEALRKKVADQKIWDRIIADRSFDKETGRIRPFYTIIESKINSVIDDAVAHNPENYWAQTNSLTQSIMASTELVFGQQKNAVLNMEFNYGYVFPRLTGADSSVIENFMRRTFPVDFKIITNKNKNTVYLGYTQDLFAQYALHPDTTNFRQLAEEFLSNLQNSKLNAHNEIYDPFDYPTMLNRLEFALRKMVEVSYQPLTYSQRMMLRQTEYLYQLELAAYKEAKRKDDEGYAKLWKESYKRVEQNIGYSYINSVEYLHAMTVQAGASAPYNLAERNNIEACKSFKLGN